MRSHRYGWPSILCWLLLVLTFALQTTSAQPSNRAKEVAARAIKSSSRSSISLAMDLWKNAELPFEEHKTMAILSRALRKGGFHVEEGVAQMPTALVASYGSGHPVIGLFAEMDGVPGRAVPAAYEDVIAGVESPSGLAVNHACQHNLVAVSAVQAALALKEVLQVLGLSGTIKVFSAPAEEVLFGKVYMVKAGLFEDVDAILSWHSDRFTNARYNASQAIDTVRVRVEKSGDKNPLRYFKAFDQNLDFLRDLLPGEQEISEPAIIKGGGRPGFIPELVEAWYSLRAYDRQSVEELNRKLQQVADFVRRLSGADMEVERINGVYPRLPNLALVEILDRNLRRHWPPRFTPQERALAAQLQQAYQEGNPSFRATAPLHEDRLAPPIRAPKPAANDNGDVSWVVPLAAVSGGSRPMGLPTHNWQSTVCAGMSIGHKVMLMMTRTLADAAIDLITMPQELQRVRQEFEEKTRDFVYRPLVPNRPPIEFYHELNRVFGR